MVETIKEGNVKNVEVLWHQIDHSILHASIWYQMMKLYKNKGYHDQVLELYKEYLQLNDESEPDEFFFNLVMHLNPSIMKNPGNKCIYSKICQFIDEKMNENQSNEYMSNSLLDYYTKINNLKGVINTFNKMDIKHKRKYAYCNVMRAYLDNDMNKDVIDLFFSKEMHNNNRCSQMIDDVTCLLALKACTNTKDEENGKKIHSFISKYNYDGNIKLRSTLIVFYGKIGDIETAVKIFNQYNDSNKSVVCCNAMMQAYLDNYMDNSVIDMFFSKVSCDGHSQMIDDVTCMLALKACGNMKDEQNGKNISNFVLNDRQYNCQKNIELFNTLIAFYGKIGEIETAMTIFDKKNDSNKTVVCCNTMMQAYLDNDMNQEALQLFFSLEKKIRDHVGIMLGLKACGNLKDKKNFSKIFNFILNETRYIINQNTELSNGLISFYGKIGEIEKAHKIFNEIDNRYKNIICYGTMMQAYLDNKMNKEVIKLFFSSQMINRVTCLLALKACGNAKSYHKQVETIYSKICDNKHLFQDSTLVSQLISCYGKLGRVEQSEEIFDKYLQFGSVNHSINKDSVAALSCMMNSYGRSRLGNKSINLFLKLKNDAYFSAMKFDILKNSFKMKDIDTMSVLYTTLISACSHSCLANEAKQFYNEYMDYYNIVLNKLKKTSNNNVKNGKLKALEIHNGKAHCALVDAFARKGLLDQAWQFCIEFENNILSEQSFLALLSGCRNHNNEDMANKTMIKIEKLVLSRYHLYNNDKNLSKEYLDSIMASSFVLVHNILTSIGKKDAANKIDLQRKMKGWYKRRGIAEIVIPDDDIGIVHSFTAGDEYKKDYPNDWKQMDQLWDEWKIKLQKLGFKHDDKSMTRQLQDTETVEYVLCRHAEKLALLYGVLKMPNKKDAIYINKNMRMCADCHEATKNISKILKRIIIVHDANAIHKFDGKGNCGCCDYY